MDEPTPDANNSLLFDTVRDAAFPLLNSPSEDYQLEEDKARAQESARLLKSLLKRRNGLKQDLAVVGSLTAARNRCLPEADRTDVFDEVYGLQWQLGRLSRYLKKQKKERLDARDGGLVEQIEMFRNQR